jgi:RNA-binding protein
MTPDRAFATPSAPAAALTGKQRRYLRSLAHAIDPLIQIGKEGLSEALLAAVGRALDDHELIKVRVLESAPLDRHAVALPLAAAVSAHPVGTVGRIVMLYRQRAQHASIKLPAAANTNAE